MEPTKLLLVCIFYLSIFRGRVVDGYGDKSTKVKRDIRHPILLFTTKEAIKTLDLTTKTVKIKIENVTDPYGITCDAAKNLVYWASEIQPKSYSLHRFNIADNGDSAEELIEKGLTWPETVAFDWITGNLYFVELSHAGSYAHIGFCHTEQRFCAFLVYEDLGSPRGLALHPNKGIFFYTDWGESAHITRCVMDGSNCQKIISSNLKWPNSVAVDEKTSRIYFADANFNRIESTTFDGTDRRGIIQLSMGRPFGLALLEDKLYWSDWIQNKIYSCNKLDGSNVQALTNTENSTLFNIAILDLRIQPKYRQNSCLRANCSHLCTLGLNNSFRCHCPVGMTLNTKNTSCIKCEEIFSCLNSDCKLNCNKTLHLNTPHTQACKDGWKLPTDGSRLCEDINECEESFRNDCDHDCVNTIGSYRCTCHSSYRLDLDGKRCVAEGLPPLLVFLNNSELFTVNTSFLEAVKLNTNRITVDSFDVDSHNQDIYWSSMEEGIIGKSDSNGRSKIIVTGLVQPRYIAFDWVSDNIYFISSQTNDSNANTSLVVCHLGAPGLCTKLYDLGNVVVSSLKLCPEDHNLFWIENSMDGEFRIRKGFFDGSDPEDCITDLRTINGMSIDQARKKIFWIIQNEILMEGNLNCSHTRQTMDINIKEKSVLSFDMINYENMIAISNGIQLYYCQIKPTVPCFNPFGSKSVTHFNFLQTSLQPPGNDPCKVNICNAELCLPSKNGRSGYACLPVITDISKQIKNQNISPNSVENETSNPSTVVIVIAIIVVTTVLATALVLYYTKFLSQKPSPFSARFRFNSSESGTVRKPVDSIYEECSIDPLAHELNNEDMWNNIH